MEKPVIENFGLTENQVKDHESLNDKMTFWIISSGFLLGALLASGFFIFQGKGDWTLLIAIPLFGIICGGSMGFMSGFALIGIYYLVLRYVSPTYNKIRLYKKAKEEYDFWWLRTQQLFWLSLNGKRFEQELALLFSELGFKVSLTPTIGDKGIDIYLKKDNKQIIVQCKARKKPVGPAVVRELFGSLKDSKCDEAILASISGFTSGVREFVNGKPISLLSLEDIIRLKNKKMVLY